MPAACQTLSAGSRVDALAYVVTPLRCKRWTCVECARLNKRQLLARLKDTRPTAFLTLTCDPKRFESSAEAFALMSLRLNTLVKRIRRRIDPAPFAYFVVWERTRSGWPHAHLLIAGPYLPQRWLSRNWQELTGAPIIDIRQVRSPHDAVLYLAKYLTKDLSVPPGCKRFRSSRGFLAPPPPSPLFALWPAAFWQLWHADVPTVARDLASLGWTPMYGPYGLLVALLDIGRPLMTPFPLAPPQEA